MDYSAFAEQNPRHAYRLLQVVVAELIERLENLKVNGVMMVSKRMDGEEAAHNVGEWAKKEFEADIDIEAIDVIVSVYRKPSFRWYIDILRTGESIETMATFHVEPPNLAF